MKLIDRIIELYKKHLDDTVEHYWNIYHFDMEPGHISYNNEGDAFKHTYMSAELSMLLGNTIAKWIVYKHEDFPENPEAEKAMDLHNDDYGLYIAKQMKYDGWTWLDNFFATSQLRDQIASRVMMAMSSGKLITKP